MNKYYLVFDTETSGLPLKINRTLDYSNILLYQISYIKFNTRLKPCKKLNLYIDIIDYNKFIYVEKNNITEQQLKNGIKIKNFLSFYKKILKNVKLIIGHNIDFDISILMEECKRNKEYELLDLLLNIPKFDTMRIVHCTGLTKKIFISQEDTYNLLYNRLNNEKNNYITAHDAYDDTLHCAQIFVNLFPLWDKMILMFGNYKNKLFGETPDGYRFFFYSKKDDEIIKIKNTGYYKQNNFLDFLNWVLFYFNENSNKLTYYENKNNNK